MTTEHTLDVKRAWQALATRNIGHNCCYCETHPDAPSRPKDQLGLSHRADCPWLGMDRAIASAPALKRQRDELLAACKRMVLWVNEEKGIELTEPDGSDSAAPCFLHTAIADAEPETSNPSGGTLNRAENG